MLIHASTVLLLLCRLLLLLTPVGSSLSSLTLDPGTCPHNPKPESVFSATTTTITTTTTSATLPPIHLQHYLRGSVTSTSSTSFYTFPAETLFPFQSIRECFCPRT
jgi:hypothetical protein